MTQLLRDEALSVLGETEKSGKRLVLVGQDGPEFWDHFTASAEYHDGNRDPLDRWSERVLTRIAKAVDATAIFPFGAPPFQPFYSWALSSGGIFASPVALLVQDGRGLDVSFRGALLFDEPARAPDIATSPCATCAGKPCRRACPVGALTPEGYDTARCKDHLRSPDGYDCLTHGCIVRRSCPAGSERGNMRAQREFHTKAFLGQ